MKKIFTIMIVGCLLMISSTSQAQLFYKGIKGGLNISNIKGLDQLPGISNTDTYTGWHAGVLLGVNLPIVDVQADILYSQQGVTYTDVLAGEPADLENSYVLIPIMGKLGFLPVVNLQLGFQYAFLTSSLLDGDSEVEVSPGEFVDTKDLFKSGYGSFIVGLGFDISKLTIDFRYDLGISDINDYEQIFTDQALKNQNFQLSAGIKF